MCRHIVNIDVSHVVIKQMKTKAKPGLEFLQMDALNTSFEDGEFAVVLDKGTLDALMPDSTDETLERVNKLFLVSTIKICCFLLNSTEFGMVTTR